MSGMRESEYGRWRRMLFAVGFGLALATAVVGPATAGEIVAADRSAIAARVAEFDTVMKAQRYGDVFNFMPPRMFAMISGGSGIEPEKFKDMLAAQMAEAMKMVQLVAFKMDVDAAVPALTPDRKRGYMLIPTETIMEIPGGQRLRSTSNTVALYEEGVWYLIRIDNAQQIVMLRKVYPEFTGVEFPSGSMAAID